MDFHPALFPREELGFQSEEIYCSLVRGGGVKAGVSFLFGFFCSCSVFWEAVTVLPFLGFFLRSQLLISCSERSSAGKNCNRNLKLRGGKKIEGEKNHIDNSALIQVNKNAQEKKIS